MSQSRAATVYCYADSPLVVVTHGYEIRAELHKNKFKYSPVGVESVIEPKSWILLTESFAQAKTAARDLKKNLQISNNFVVGTNPLYI